MMPLTQDLFIAPGTALTGNDLKTSGNIPKNKLRARWRSREGHYILTTWKARNFERAALEELVGRHWDDRIDIRGIPLVGQNLAGCDLHEVDLYGADLTRTNLTRANLKGAWLSEANIKGATFDWAALDGALTDNVEFDNSTSFTGVNLNAVNFTLATLLQDAALSQQRIQNLEARRPLLAFVLWVTCDYGRSFPRFLLWCLGLVVGFALVYVILPKGLSQPGLWNALLFSVSSFITLGIDVQPASGAARALMVLEAILGYAMTGLLIAILVRRTIGD